MARAVRIWPFAFAAFAAILLGACTSTTSIVVKPTQTPREEAILAQFEAKLAQFGAVAAERRWADAMIDPAESLQDAIDRLLVGGEPAAPEPDAAALFLAARGLADAPSERVLAMLREDLGVAEAQAQGLTAAATALAGANLTLNARTKALRAFEQALIALKRTRQVLARAIVSQVGPEGAAGFAPLAQLENALRAMNAAALGLAVAPPAAIG